MPSTLGFELQTADDSYSWEGFYIPRVPIRYALEGIRIKHLPYLLTLCTPHFQISHVMVFGWLVNYASRYNAYPEVSRIELYQFLMRRSLEDADKKTESTLLWMRGRAA